MSPTPPAAGNLPALGAGTGWATPPPAPPPGPGRPGPRGLVVSSGPAAPAFLAGGVVAYGVGDFAHNLIDENWGEDIHKYGVVGGVFAGIGDSAVKTGDDIAHVGESIWHGITSIF